MPDRPRAGERWTKVSGEVAVAIPAAALLRATVAGMQCRERFNAGRVAEATIQLALMHDAISAVGSAELDPASEEELLRLIQLERELAAALRRTG